MNENNNFILQEAFLLYKLFSVTYFVTTLYNWKGSYKLKRLFFLI